MSTWVIDAGPLLFLAKLERLVLLHRNATVLVPEAAYIETQQHNDDAAFVIAEAAHTWLKVRSIRNQGAVRLLLADLDLGEAEAIVLAEESKADRLILDDMDARRFAHRVGFVVIGTVGLLLSARLRGEIPSLRAEIERLEQFGFWISPDLVSQVLQTAGENE